jgi:Tetratricopeptide repeat
MLTAYIKTGLARFRPEASRHRSSLLASAFTVLAGSALLCSPCQSAPPQKNAEQSTAPPSAPESSAPGTVAVDLSPSVDPNGFRAKVSQDQRIHVHLDFGRVFEQKGNLEAALMEYQQALAACERKGMGRTRSTDEALAQRRIANTLDRMGRFAQAEVHYRKALHLSPRDPKIWNDAGYSYYLQGRWADAERTLKTAAKYAPEDERITTNLGLTLAASGRSKEAISMLSRYNGNAIGHANLGFLLAATGQVELAKQQYLQALALRPNLGLAQRALSQLDHAAGAEHVAGTQATPEVRPVAAPAQVGSSAGRDADVVKTSGMSTKIPPPRRFSVNPPLPTRTLP